MIAAGRYLAGSAGASCTNWQEPSSGCWLASCSHSAQSSPNSSTGCWVRMVPFPQSSESAEQYLSQPQHTRSGCFGLSGNLGIATRPFLVQELRSRSVRRFGAQPSPNRFLVSLAQKVPALLPGTKRCLRA